MKLVVGVSFLGSKNPEVQSLLAYETTAKSCIFEFSDLK